MAQPAVNRFCLKVVSPSGQEIYRGCKNRFPTDIPTYLSGVEERLRELDLGSESSVAADGSTQEYLVTVPEGKLSPTAQQCRYVISGSEETVSSTEREERLAEDSAGPIIH